jgi:hypothetical protein
MNNEDERAGPIEETKLTPTNEIVEEMTNYIKGERLESTKFQAFADYADYMFAVSKMRGSSDNILFQFEYCLIQETKRQRKNGVRGYKEEYEEIEQLGKRLGRSITADRNHGKTVHDISSYLGQIKNAFIQQNPQRT